jgi:surface antigen
MTSDPNLSLWSRRAKALTVASLLGLAAGAAQAVSGYDTFNKMPASSFSKEDTALMMARVDQALKAEKDGETLEWKNDATPASGSVTPLARFTSDGLACRRLRIVNAYGSNKAQGVYRFCEKPPGKWKLIGPDPAPG